MPAKSYLSPSASTGTLGIGPRLWCVADGGKSHEIRHDKPSSAYAATVDYKVTAEIAQAHAESDFERYRIVQDRLFESDFDRMTKKLPETKNPKSPIL